MERSAWSRAIRRGLAVVGLTTAALHFGCLTRPISQLEPTDKAIVHTELRQESVDKVDILFAIDNSASMGDKQELFKEAVPDLIHRLLVPDCETPDGKTRTAPTSTAGALSCPTGMALEFPPVHDLHLGVVTSALGGGGSPDVCDGSAPTPAGITRHDDDHGRLVTRTKPVSGTEGAVARTKPVSGEGGGFLAWLPSAAPENAGKPAPNVSVAPDEGALEVDFQSLVSGVQEYGCGLEGQLESWYRFLVQPDPWESIGKARANTLDRVGLQGVDAVLLKQRKDFLRPDSLVAVIMLTDEEDSWSDPLALDGRGWITRTQSVPSPLAHDFGTMPRATSACATDPTSPACTSCMFGGKIPGTNTPIADDPECKKGFYAKSEDQLNVRYTNDMKRRYGFDPQFPIQRYVDGLRSKKVPNRDGEHPGGAGPYVGDANCTNPLFAKELPDGTDPNPAKLCGLTVGPRAPDQVFFAVIGGVPWQLLAEDGSDPKSAFKASLSDADWKKILGKNPATFDGDGIDPHMIESIAPRAGLPPPSASNTADPISGREWDTKLVNEVGLDLQYACTFELPTPKDCTDPSHKGACDCVGTATGPGGSPLCNGTTQVRGKAYPTVRELRVARGLGDHGVVGSLCARNVKDKSASDYGYRPAVRAIVDRLKKELGVQCLPRALSPQSDGTVACLVLVEGTGLVCDPTKGLREPEPAVAQNYRARKLEERRKLDPNATVGDLCEMVQVPAPQYQNGTCEGGATPGWCYVTGGAANGCTQAVRFAAPVPSGATINLQCIDQSM
jgi:hypothetical protein